MKLSPSHYTLKIRRKKNSIKVYKDEEKIQKVNKEIAVLEVAKTIVMLHNLDEIKMLHRLNTLEYRSLIYKLKRKKIHPNDRRDMQNQMEWKEIRKLALDYILEISTHVKNRPAKRVKKKAVWLKN